jgi:hypothetical protein
MRRALEQHEFYSDPMTRWRRYGNTQLTSDDARMSIEQHRSDRVALERALLTLERQAGPLTRLLYPADLDSVIEAAVTHCERFFKQRSDDASLNRFAAIMRQLVNVGWCTAAKTLQQANGSDWLQYLASSMPVPGSHKRGRKSAIAFVAGLSGRAPNTIKAACDRMVGAGVAEQEKLAERDQQRRRAFAEAAAHDVREGLKRLERQNAS